NGRLAANVERVTLRFNFVEEDLGESELVLRSRGDGVFSGQGSNVLRVGAWKVDLQIRRQGRDDALASLEVRARDQNIVATAPGTVTPAGGLVATEGGFILGVELALFGLVLGLGAQRLGGKRRRYRVLGVQLAAVLILGGGSYLATTSYATAIYPKTLTNPFPPTQASLQKGGEIYTNNCVSCHGLSGRGDGPLARTLTPRPADLRVHVSQHADGQLYTWIANGVPGTAMPPFKDRLSDEERWHVLNYLKSLTRPQS
ncbi:MAG: cytochrome c, partial [Chloroflexi bacterium]|nr:cytochrome c [Chloroflexota bacterium]